MKKSQLKPKCCYSMFVIYGTRRMGHLSSTRLFRRLISTTALVLLLILPALSQQQTPVSIPSNTMNPVDLLDVIANMAKKKGPARSDSVVVGVKNISLLPIVGYGPANGFVLGAAVGISLLTGNRENTQLSSALMSASFTSKKQIMLCMRSNIYLPGNKWYMPGDVRFLFFAQPTYGLGIYDLNTPAGFSFNGENVSKSRFEQPMRFNYFRFYESAVRKIFGKWYAGLGINIDLHRSIEDQSLKLDTPNVAITSNYLYSKKYGFNPEQYSTNGLSFQFINDSRDNSINAYKGTYFNLRFRMNPNFLGSSQNSTMTYYELRNYIPLQKSKPGHVLALWTWGDFVTSGSVPYLALPAIGWDTYGRTGRGYVQGRLRGVNMMYGEAEYRLPISRNGLIGAVAFMNATTASNPMTNQAVLDAFAPGYGFGLRIKMNKKDRTNICVDYGIGKGSTGLYFNIQETF
jgi:hypothetical protein